VSLIPSKTAADPELQVCPIPRYLREQEVVTSRHRHSDSAPSLHYSVMFACMGKLFLVFNV